MSTLTEAVPAADQAATVEMTYREAINAALDDSLASDPAVLLMGEDVDADGGVFKTNGGLVEKYGRERVRVTPIAENGFVGVALGMSLVGLRPIVEIMFADFLPTAGDAIVNQLPKYRFMSGGQCNVPVTIRVIGGATGRFGTQHSATFESWFMHLPGLRVASGSSPGSAYSVLRAAVQENNPVIFFEHKGLYARKGPVKRGEIAEFGKAAVGPRGRRRDHRRNAPHGRTCAEGRRSARCGRHRRRGDRPPLGPPARPPDGQVVGRERAGSSSPRSRSTPAAGERRSSRSWPRRASRSPRHRAGSASRTTTRSRTRRRSRTSSSRRSTASPLQHGPPRDDEPKPPPGPSRRLEVSGRALSSSSASRRSHSGRRSGAATPAARTAWTTAARS